MTEPTSQPSQIDSLIGQLESLQRAVVDLQAEVEAQAPMVSLGTLTASIAHEVANRLTPIAAYAQMALQQPGDADLTRRALEQAAVGGRRTAELAETILAMARPGRRVGPGTTDLAEAWARVADLISGQARERGVVVRAEVGPGLVVAASPASVEHVLLNLALNALAAMGAGGTLEVGGTKCSTWNTSCVRCVLSDSGAGMESDRAEAAMAGRTGGLGLSLCDRLVRAVGGQLGIASEPGKGTTVTVLWPEAGAGSEAA